MRHDDLATRLSAEYALFLLALSGRYQQMRAPGVTVTPRAVNDLNYTAHELANTFYQIATDEIENYLRPMVEDASESVADGLVVRKKEALSHLRAMLLENAHQVVKTARTGITGAGNLLQGSVGAIGLLVQRQAGTIQFKATDTSGRKWDAEKLLKVVMRDFAYQAWIDFRLAQISAHGHDQAAAVARDVDGNVVAKAVFSISGEGRGPALSEIRNVLFHPNSNNDVEPFNVPS